MDTRQSDNVGDVAIVWTEDNYNVHLIHVLILIVIVISLNIKECEILSFLIINIMELLNELAKESGWSNGCYTPEGECW